MTIAIPLDFSQVQEFEATPAGVYAAVIEKLKVKPTEGDIADAVARITSADPEGRMASNGKFDQISVEYTITDDKQTGDKVFANLSFSPKAAFRMMAFFKAFDLLGIPGLQIEPDTGIVLSPDLSGIAVQIKVAVEKYNGENRSKVNEPPFVVNKAQLAQAVPTDAKVATGSSRGKGRNIR